eukprot:3931180-Amphidinium_carterae.1
MLLAFKVTPPSAVEETGLASNEHGMSATEVGRCLSRFRSGCARNLLLWRMEQGHCSPANGDWFVRSALFYPSRAPRQCARQRDNKLPPAHRRQLDMLRHSSATLSPFRCYLVLCHCFGSHQILDSGPVFLVSAAQVVYPIAVLKMWLRQVAAVVKTLESLAMEHSGRIIWWDLPIDHSQNPERVTVFGNSLVLWPFWLKGQPILVLRLVLHDCTGLVQCPSLEQGEGCLALCLAAPLLAAAAWRGRVAEEEAFRMLEEAS